MLKPQLTPTRELVSLDGLWKFELVTGEPEDQQPWTKRLGGHLEAPVPASYNDIFVDPKIREHVGWVSYQRSARIPKGWDQERYFIRIEAATHQGRVYVNDNFVVEHMGGYTPFDAEITGLVRPGEEFRLTVLVSNELTNTTIPPGRITVKADGTRKQAYHHDFYNYAGLARSVWLYSVPHRHIEDVTLITDFHGSTGSIKYSIKTQSSTQESVLKVRIVDEDEKVVAEATGSDGEIKIESVKLWQPGAAYLYEFRVSIEDANSQLIDTYSVATGIRKVEIRGNQFLINDKPFYFTGFGKHEDTAVRGKGHDQAYMVHDFQLMDWIGANSFRTSHYPYAEEVLEYADRQGIVVIDETAAVGLNVSLTSEFLGGKKVQTWCPEECNDQTREAHAQAIRELVARDKNHPCVVLWSIANEPDSSGDGAREYFQPLVELTRKEDPTRPVCFINFMLADFNNDLISDLFDVLCLNRYYGWYEDQGDLEMSETKLETELLEWEKKYGKPILMTEYGADTLAGLHSIQNVPWSEEFQVNYYKMYHRVHDRVKSLVGEQVWNFADFQTSIKIFRVDGNHKGIFTRDRRPKAIAHVLRERWTEIRANKNQVASKAEVL